MSVGFGLIKSLIEGNHPISVLREAGIDEAYFLGDDRRAYLFLLDHYRRYNAYPQLATLAIEIGDPSSFESLPSEPPEYWIRKVQDRWRFNQIQDSSRQVDRLLERENIDQAVDLIRETANRLRSSYSESRVIDIRAAQSQVIVKHNAIQSCSERLPGVTFGFPYIDEVSGGAQPGDAITIVGQTSVGKTFLALKVALSAYYSGKDVLIVSTEMPYVQLARRALAMEAGLSTTHLKMGRLSYFGVQKAIEVSQHHVVVDGKEHYLRILPGGLFKRVDDIDLIIQEQRPHLMVIDGAYLLRLASPRNMARWEKAMEIMEQIKDAAMRLNTPIIATYQYNKEAPGTIEGIAGTLAIAQLSSIVFSYEFENKNDANSSNPIQYRILKILKGRDGESGSIRVLSDMMRSKIEQYSVITGYTEDRESNSEFDPVEMASEDPFSTI